MEIEVEQKCLVPITLRARIVGHLELGQTDLSAAHCPSLLNNSSQEQETLRARSFQLAAVRPPQHGLVVLDICCAHIGLAVTAIRSRSDAQPEAARHLWPGKISPARVDVPLVHHFVEDERLAPGLAP